jgi:hypothetical protein
VLADLAERFQEAVQAFWDARDRQQQKQIDAGKIDAGSRGAVTGGTQMGALETLLTDVLLDAGLGRADISARTALALPGYYRPEKKWDLLVVADHQLGYFFLLEDCASVHASVSSSEPYFKVDPVFDGASYSRRYEILCQRLVLERKYTSACLTLATKANPTSVSFPADTLNFRQFAAAIDAHARAFINTR